MADMDPFVIHFNARVHGMKADLLSHHAVEEFLEQGDLTRMVDDLLDSPYRTEMAEALTRYEGADAVEEAVSRNLVATFQTLQGRAHGEFRTLVALFLGRWDLTAVKSVLRSQHHGLDGVAGAVMPGPNLTPPILKELSQADSMESLISGLAGWNGDLCRCLRGALPEYEETNDLCLLEEALDRAYFVENAARLKSSESSDGLMLRSQLQAEIDRINLRTVFQYIETGGGDNDTPLDERFLGQGTLPKSLLRQMAQASDPAAAMEQLGRTRYSALVEELYQLLETKRFSPMERFFERLLMRNVRQSARNNVFGIGVMMDYVWLKHNEAINIRLIARGLAGNLPTGRVRDELYAV
jgi:vacuolar-type H+-ATPase subunit C/Vma6